MTYNCFKLCAAYGWIFGCFPVSCPVVKGLGYNFKRKHPIFVFSLLAGLLYFSSLLQTCIDPLPVVEGQKMAFHEEVAFRLLMIILLVSDACVRGVLVFRTESVIHILGALEGIRYKLADKSTPKVSVMRMRSNRFECKLNWVAFLICCSVYWSYVTSRLIYFYAVIEFDEVQYGFLSTPWLQGSLWHMRVFYFWQDHSHDFALFFSFFLIFLLGTEVSAVYDLTCKNIVRIRKEFSPTRNADSIAAEHQKKRDAEGAMCSTFDKMEHVRFGTVVSDACENFKTVVDSFEEYRHISGLLCMGLLMESTYELFFSVKNIVTESESSALVNYLGAGSGVLLLIMISNVGDVIETQIGKSQEALRASRAVYRNHIVLQDENEEKHLIALEDWILNWNWRLSAMNLFHINRSLVISVLVVILSYVLIFFQLKSSPVSSIASVYNNSAQVKGILE